MVSIDREFQHLIPPLAAEERNALESSIKTEGCRDALVVWKENGKPLLLDGHHRKKICEKHGIGFKTVERKFATRDEAKLWIIDNQFGRRNLPDIDRIALATKREAILRGPADERKKAGMGSDGSGGRGRKKTLPQNCDKVSRAPTTSALAAKAAGVGERTYDAGKLVLDAAEKGEISQGDVDAIRRKEKSIHRVAKDIKEKRQKTKRQTERKCAAAKAEPQFFDNVHVGDFRKLGNKVENGSLSLIFTDPPYDRKSLELFDGLGKFAADKLCDGGSLICYVGQTQLPFAMDSLWMHLRYWWTICCFHSGGANLMKEYGVRCGWKAVLWFVKNTRDDKEDIVSDVMTGGREKSHHDWQQAQAEAEYWIKNLCPKDGIVCDPFLGGGTTAAAAIKLKRKWVGFEKDHDQAVMAMQRCAK